MLPMLQKHLIITTALIATMSLTACGSKKDINGGAPPVEAGKTETAQPQKNTQTAETNGSLGGGLPDPNSSGNDDYMPPLPEPIPKAEVPKKETPKSQLPKTQTPKAPAPPKSQAPSTNYPAPPTQNAPAAPPAPGVVGVNPAVAESHDPIPANYKSDDHNSIFRTDLPKRTTGSAADNGLVYTSTATDDLHNFLRARNNRVNAESRRLNLAAASSVQSAQLSMNSGETVITLKVQEGNSVNTYNLAGSQNLRVVRSANGEVTTGTRALEGTVKCLDFDGGCETVFARLQIGSTGSSGIINLVFRTSAASLYFSLPAEGAHSNSAEFVELQDFILNTITRANTSAKITGVRMASWEVVNGRSGVSVAFKGGAHQYLGFAAPLVAPQKGTSVNATATKLTSADASVNYSNWIGDAKLIANNGLGQVRFGLKMKKSDDQWAVTVMRKLKPVVELTDANLK